jgi:hypothetical protein
VIARCCSRLMQSLSRVMIRVSAAALLATLCTASPASADPLHIKSGYFHLYYNDMQPEPDLEGDFEFIAGSTRLLGFTSVLFALGSELNGGGQLDRGSVKSIGAVISGGGHAFTPTTELSLDEAMLSFTSPPRRVSCPDFECTVAAPFSLRGKLSVTPYDSDTYGGPFELSLLGHGTGVARFCCRTSEASFQDALYTFGETPAQTPEPASLVLAGIGLLGVSLRIHGRRNQSFRSRIGGFLGTHWSSPRLPPSEPPGDL